MSPRQRTAAWVAVVVLALGGLVLYRRTLREDRDRTRATAVAEDERPRSRGRRLAPPPRRPGRPVRPAARASVPPASDDASPVEVIRNPHLPGDRDDLADSGLPPALFRRWAGLEGRHQRVRTLAANVDDAVRQKLDEIAARRFEQASLAVGHFRLGNQTEAQALAAVAATLADYDREVAAALGIDPAELARQLAAAAPAARDATRGAP
jgi:hypothetical protein